MKICFAGDVHGDINNLLKIFKYAKDNNCDLIIQVGDFGYGFPGHKNFLNKIKSLIRQFNIPLYFIKGNHDNHEWLVYKKITKLSDNFFFIPNGVNFEFDSVKFIAYGGAYSIDKARRTEGKDWWRDEEISIQDVNDSVGKTADIIISHDAPYTSNIADMMYLLPIEEAMENRKKLQAIVEEIKPKFLIHGHYHFRGVCSANYTDGDIVTWFPSLSLGANVTLFVKQCYILDTEIFKKENP